MIQRMCDANCMIDFQCFFLTLLEADKFLRFYQKFSNEFCSFNRYTILRISLFLQYILLKKPYIYPQKIEVVEFPYLILQTAPILKLSKVPGLAYTFSLISISLSPIISLQGQALRVKRHSTLYWHTRIALSSFIHPL